MEILGIAGVAVISVICYLFGIIFKAWDAFDDRKIPAVMGILGGILGVVSYLIAPAIVPASDPITALAVGIVSGLAATGINQIYKQGGKES